MKDITLLKVEKESFELFKLGTLPKVCLFGAIVGAGVLNLLVRGHLIYYQIKYTPNRPINLLVVHNNVRP